VREHRKRQRVEPSTDGADPQAEGPAAEGAGTSLASQSANAAHIFGRPVPAENAKLYLGLVNKVLKEPVPAFDLTELPAIPLKQHREMLFQCRQRVRFTYCKHFSIASSPLFFLTKCCIGVAVGL
jgi:hypothetical protein